MLLFIENLTPSGQASLSSTLTSTTKAIKAIQPPISNTFMYQNHVLCTHTNGYRDENPLPAWWMFEFSFESAYITEIQIYYREGRTTNEGHHTVYTSNDSNTWTSGTVLYNGTILPTEIHFDAILQFLTYVPPVQNPTIELELCEIGIIGCPPTHYGPLCNTTCPQNCDGPCDLDVGLCTFGCIKGWIGNTCEQACDDGYFGNKCANRCHCLTEPCSKGEGICPPSGCNEGWYGDSCNKECKSGYFGRNCREFCGGCISNICDKLNGLCTNTTGCKPGYLYEDYCNISA
ncbi:unnamed protein product [Mytilus edulis]|uniref:Uncharacterized protein n=1 Tax=Mytilus edulis TaxID=6550 RepID=A0A8S3T4E5_MYTED|nr:unnamed protein product [Mytilus edulis]